MKFIDKFIHSIISIQNPPKNLQKKPSTYYNKIIKCVVVRNVIQVGFELILLDCDLDIIIYLIDVRTIFISMASNGYKASLILHFL